MIELVNYHGMARPRYQTCAFCKTKYDALDGPKRPHASCAACYVGIQAHEKEIREKRSKVVRESADKRVIREDRGSYRLYWCEVKVSYGWAHHEIYDYFATALAWFKGTLEAWLARHKKGETGE